MDNVRRCERERGPSPPAGSLTTEHLVGSKQLLRYENKGRSRFAVTNLYF